MSLNSMPTSLQWPILIINDARVLFLLIETHVYFPGFLVGKLKATGRTLALTLCLLKIDARAAE